MATYATDQLFETNTRSLASELPGHEPMTVATGFYKVFRKEDAPNKDKQTLRSGNLDPDLKGEGRVVSVDLLPAREGQAPGLSVYLHTLGAKGTDAAFVNVAIVNLVSEEARLTSAHPQVRAAGFLTTEGTLRNGERREACPWTADGWTRAILWQEDNGPLELRVY